MLLVAPRVLTVGDPNRARVVAQLLDGATIDPLNPMSLGPSVFMHESNRGFTTYTGTFEGVPVSIVAIGMGYPMMDFFVREGRTIVSGPMAIIRFGSCGSLDPEEEIGSFCVVDTSILVRRNVDAMLEEKSDQPYYLISKPCEASKDLTDVLKRSMEDAGVVVNSGINATADSFYCSQGRLEDAFVDHNDGLLANLRTNYNIRTLDMETFHLFHLAKCATKVADQSIKSAAVKIIFANRVKDLFIVCDETKKELEKTGGLFCLRALKNIAL